MDKTKYFTKDDRKLLLELICNEQIHMIIKDNTKYLSDKYKKLEVLKAKVNALEVKKFVKLVLVTNAQAMKMLTTHVETAKFAVKQIH